MMLPASASSSKRLADYQARKVEGRCVYPCCAELAADDSVLCPGHRDALRKRRRRSAARVRAALRDAGKCVCCRRRSSTYYCPACSVRLGRVPSTVVDNSVDNRKTPRFRIEPAARGRKAVARYIGKARRGAPSAATLDDQDLDYAAEEIRKAKAALAYARSDSVRGMPKIQRDGVMAAALGRVGSAGRWLEEVLARHKSL